MQAVSGSDSDHVDKLTVNVYISITATVMNKTAIPFIVMSHFTAILLDIFFTDFYNCLQFDTNLVLTLTNTFFYVKFDWLSMKL